MEPMTPEERFTKIENLLSTMTEHAAGHEERLARLEENAEKNEAAIRDLIVVSRVLVDSQQKLAEAQQELIDSQQKAAERTANLETKSSDWDARMAALTEKLHILIETVDRIIRDKQ
jgi:hypothetical protein